MQLIKIIISKLLFTIAIIFGLIGSYLCIKEFNMLYLRTSTHLIRTGPSALEAGPVLLSVKFALLQLIDTTFFVGLTLIMLAYFLSWLSKRQQINATLTEHKNGTHNRAP